MVRSTPSAIVHCLARWHFKQCSRLKRFTFLHDLHFHVSRPSSGITSRDASCADCFAKSALALAMASCCLPKRAIAREHSVWSSSRSSTALCNSKSVGNSAPGEKSVPSALAPTEAVSSGTMSTTRAFSADLESCNFIGKWTSVKRAGALVMSDRRNNGSQGASPLRKASPSWTQASRTSLGSTCLPLYMTCFFWYAAQRTLYADRQTGKQMLRSSSERWPSWMRISRNVAIAFPSELRALRGVA